MDNEKKLTGFIPVGLTAREYFELAILLLDQSGLTWRQTENIREKYEWWVHERGGED